MIDAITQRQHRLLNMLHTWLLVAGSLGLFVVCAWIFFGPAGIWFALAFGGISLFVAMRVSPSLVLRMYRAQPVSREQFPTGHTLLDRLSERAGLEHRPRLFVMPSNLMNAFAVGSRREAAICITDRLARALTTRELAGVLAHEVAHVQNNDIKVMALADMVSRFTSILSTLGIVSVLVNLPAILFGGGPQVPWLAVALLVASPTIGGLLQLALSRTREYDADLSAVMLTGDPDGLASALMKLEQAQGRNWEGMVLPGSRSPDPSLLRSHPKTADRIERLMALKDMAGVDAGMTRLPSRNRTKRPASVPEVAPRWGRGEEQRYRSHAPRLGVMAATPTLSPDEAAQSACEDSLAEPKGRPRIRLRAGGVYW